MGFKSAKAFEGSKKDKAADKKHGAPEGSKKDMKQDKKDGKPPMFGKKK